MDVSLDELLTTATRHLGADAGEHWTTLLRATAALVHHSSADGAVGWLGGLPPLPPSVPWPVWPEHGPLAHIATIDLGAVGRAVPDLAVPDQIVSAFYWDGSLDSGADIVHADIPESAAGALLLPILEPQEPTDSGLSFPEGLSGYRQLWLAAQPMWTWPSQDHPGVRALGPFEFTERLYRELYDTGWGRHRPAHQVGGHSYNVQGLPALDAEHWAGTAWADIDPAAAVERWSLVLQVDTDDQVAMMWGDGGVLYWLAELPANGASLGEVRFTWQCH